MTARDALATFAFDIRQAWRIRWVKLGTLATTLIVFGSLTPAYLPQNSPWWPPMRAIGLDGLPGRIGGTVVVLGALLLLTQCWFRLRYTVYAEVKHWSVLVLWSLPLVLGPPVFSHDSYAYAAQGWLILNGLNPYEVGPGALPGAFADQTSWVWRFTPTPYGPLSLRIQEAIVWASGAQPYLSAVMMRIPALIGVALIVIFLPRIAKIMGVDPQFTSWFATLNPILVMDFVGGAHNDAHMMGLMVLGIWLAYKRQWILGAVAIGVAAAIKQPALLAAYAIAFIYHPVPELRAKPVLKAVGRALLSCGIAVGTFVGISLATGFGFGWLNAASVPGLVWTIAPFNVLGSGLQMVANWLGWDPSGRLVSSVTRSVGVGVSVVIIAWLAVTTVRRKPMTFLSWSYIAFAICAPALQGWYMMWGGTILPLTRPGKRVVTWAVVASVLITSYASISVAWRNGVTALGIASMAGLLAVVVMNLRRRTNPPRVKENEHAAR